MSTGVTAPGLMAGAGGAGPVGRPGHHASPIGLDRLVRREVALGLIREIVPPQDHLGLQLFPFMEVATDDVIFNYGLGFSDGLVPARAEDAEAELSQKDDMFIGEGRASVLDWAVKDHYTASDVNRAREWLLIREQVRDTQNLPLTVNSAVEGWNEKLNRDTLRRRRKIDNRLEWLIMSALSTGTIAYNDGKIKFAVDYFRPAAQAVALAAGATTNIAGNPNYVLNKQWISTNAADMDPIRDILTIQEYMEEIYSVRITRAIASRKILNSILFASKFAQRSGLIVPGATAGSIAAADPRYVIDGWGPNAAQAIVEQQTGLTFIEYDSVYRTRAVGSMSTTNNRFLPQNRIIFLPDESDLAAFDDTGLGFGKMLTSPHPAGNWQAGFYEWEYEYGMDPWGYDAGTGIKAFPVFPHMDKSFTLDVMP